MRKVCPSVMLLLAGALALMPGVARAETILDGYVYASVARAVWQKDDRDTATLGGGFSNASQEMADSAALRACGRQGATNCEVVARFQGGACMYFTTGHKGTRVRWVIRGTAQSRPCGAPCHCGA